MIGCARRMGDTAVLLKVSDGALGSCAGRPRAQARIVRLTTIPHRRSSSILCPALPLSSSHMSTAKLFCWQ